MCSAAIRREKTSYGYFDAHTMFIMANVVSTRKSLLYSLWLIVFAAFFVRYKTPFQTDFDLLVLNTIFFASNFLPLFLLSRSLIERSIWLSLWIILANTVHYCGQYTPFVPNIHSSSVYCMRFSRGRPIKGEAKYYACNRLCQCHINIMTKTHQQNRSEKKHTNSYNVLHLFRHFDFVDISSGWRQSKPTTTNDDSESEKTKMWTFSFNDTFKFIDMTVIKNCRRRQCFNK